MGLLLRNALLVDGTGSPGRPADVAVDGERIVSVAAPGEIRPEAIRVRGVDVAGVAPGQLLRG